jgi:hypothetical protein
MVAFTQLNTPYDEDTTSLQRHTVSGVQVAESAPILRGRLLPFDVPTVERWEIETTIEERPFKPVTDMVVYLKRYLN